MFNSQGCYSLSDIAAASGNTNGRNDGWGGDGWWILILLVLFAGGWNGNGFGGNGSGSTVREEITYGFDMNNIENGIRGIQQGLCDGFYAQNTALLNSTSGIQNALCQGFNGVNTAMLQGFSGIQAQMANDALMDQKCCCETQNLINNKFCEVNYNLATQSCDTRRTITDSTRDIIDSQNAGTRAILDFLTQDKIATLQSENQALKFAASQATQNVTLGAMMEANTTEILRRTAPLPVPSYTVPNPYCGCGYNYNLCGMNC